MPVEIDIVLISMYQRNKPIQAPWQWSKNPEKAKSGRTKVEEWDQGGKKEPT